jgi:hypothetical protein
MSQPDRGACIIPKTLLMSSIAAYVYCLVKAKSRPSLAKAPRGLPGATAPEAVQVSTGLWLIVADVPLSVYGPGPLADSLGNLEWVSEVAVAHESVVEFFSRVRAATTVPMKLFTMFSSRERAIADVRSRRRELAGIIKRIADAEEWGVRVAFEPVPARGGTAAPGGSSGGAAFLAAKRDARDRALKAIQHASDTAEESFEALCGVARDFRRRDDPPAGASSPPILDATFLVSHGERARFKAAARTAAAECRRAGATMILTGPWPAYSFVQALQVPEAD